MFCKYCGEKLKDDVIFCTECGKKIVDTNDKSVQENKTSEEKGSDYDKKTAKKKSKKGIVVFIFIILFIIVLAAVGYFAYTRGYFENIGIKPTDSTVAADGSAAEDTADKIDYSATNGGIKRLEIKGEYYYVKNNYMKDKHTIDLAEKTAEKEEYYSLNELFEVESFQENADICASSDIIKFREAEESGLWEYQPIAEGHCEVYVIYSENGNNICDVYTIENINGVSEETADDKETDSKDNKDTEEKFEITQYFDSDMAQKLADKVTEDINDGLYLSDEMAMNYAIIDLNADSYPELIIDYMPGSSGIENGKYIYTYSDGEIKRIDASQAGCGLMYAAKGINTDILEDYYTSEQLNNYKECAYYYDRESDTYSCVYTAFSCVGASDQRFKTYLVTLKDDDLNAVQIGELDFLQGSSTEDNELSALIIEDIKASDAELVSCDRDDYIQKLYNMLYYERFADGAYCGHFTATYGTVTSVRDLPDVIADNTSE